jgi:hypothetical protein
MLNYSKIYWVSRMFLFCEKSRLFYQITLFLSMVNCLRDFFNGSYKPGQVSICNMARKHLHFSSIYLCDRIYFPFWLHTILLLLIHNLLYCSHPYPLHWLSMPSAYTTSVNHTSLFLLHSPCFAYQNEAVKGLPICHI